jgi:MFS superfamily sulfate permease-like transporter
MQLVHPHWHPDSSVCCVGAAVGLVLLLITPVFERLSFNATAAIILSSVIGLFDLNEAMYLAKTHLFDFFVWLAAFVGTVMLGVEAGLGIAIALAMLIVIYRSAFPHTAQLGRLPETGAMPILPIDCSHASGLLRMAHACICRNRSALQQLLADPACRLPRPVCRGVAQRSSVPHGSPEAAHLRGPSGCPTVLCQRGVGARPHS